MDMNHEDFRGNLTSNPGETAGDGVDNDNNGYIDDASGWDFYGDDNNSKHEGSDSHGTLVAGAAAASGDNDKGVAGVAYGCKLMPIRYSEGGKSFYVSDLEEAIYYAAGFAQNGIDRWHGADVINFSRGFPDDFPRIFAALQDAAQKGRNGKGCPIFCAVGNSASGWKKFQIPFGPGEFKSIRFRWEFIKDSSGSIESDTIWLDSIEFPDGKTESFELGLPFSYRTGASAPWTSVIEGISGNHAMQGYDGGSRAVRAGSIGNNGNSYIEVAKTFTSPPEGGLMSFWYWTSCSEGAGLRLKITQQNDWTNVHNFFPKDELLSGFPSVTTDIAYPASHPDTIAVGSSTRFDYRADHSRYGVELDFLAPGADIWTTSPTGTGNEDGDYVATDGTSLASPLAAGVAALMLSSNPDLTAEQVRGIMQDTCEQIGNEEYDNDPNTNRYYGHGRINASLAVNAANDTAPLNGLCLDTYGYYESFELGFGDWVNVTDSDDIDWTLHSGSTTSSGTGPPSASGGDFYLYVESTGNGEGFPNRTAILESPCINKPATWIPDFPGSECGLLFSYELHFWCHMYGAEMGELTLEVSEDEGRSWSRFWSLSGDQGPDWHLVSLSLDKYSHSHGQIKLRFKGVTGSDYTSDMAIDSISISESRGFYMCEEIVDIVDWN